MVKKDILKFQLYFFLDFLVIKTMDSDPEPNPDSLEILDPDSESMNPDPQHWFKLKGTIRPE